MFLFIQIKCGRCKQEQEYELGVHFLLALALDVLVPILLFVGGIYLFVFVNGNLMLMGVIALLVFLAIWFLRLYLYVKKFG